METWTGVALLGALGFVLGFALNHGSICTVIATRELVSEKRPARFIALVECAVWAALVYAILETSPMMQQGWSPLGYLVPAAMLFGLGTYVNGACVFGSVGHFGNGEIDFGFAFLGIFAVVYIESLFGLLPDQPPISASLPLGPGASRTCTVGHPGAEARCVTQIRIQLPAADAVDGSDRDHLYDPGGFCARVLDHSIGWIDRFDTCRGRRDFSLHVRRQPCLRKTYEASIHAEMADNQDHSQENAWGHPYGIGCATHSRWERYDADDWFPHGGMAGRARLRAICCDACCTHRKIRFDGKILVMTVAHAAHRTGRQNLPSLHHLSVRCWPGSRPSSHRAQMSEHGATCRSTTGRNDPSSNGRATNARSFEMRPRSASSA